MYVLSRSSGSPLTHDVADASAGRGLRVDAERQARDLRKLAGGRRQPRDAVVERRQHDAARHDELAHDVAERMNLEQGAARQRPRGVHAVAADAARVDDGEVGLHFGAHGVGDQVAQVGLRRAKADRDAVERHARRADDLVRAPAPASPSKAATTAAVARLVGEGAGDRDELVEALDGPAAWR